MVEKVDRPDAPPPYRVNAPGETKQDKPKEERRQEDQPTFKQQQDEALYREKFQGESAPAKTFKIPISDIGKLSFVRALPRQGVPIADANLIWKDGKKLEGVSFLIKNWQDFMRLKNLRAGEAIPEPFWNYQGEQLEVTLRGVRSSGPWNMRAIEPKPAEVPRPASSTAAIWRQPWVWGCAAGGVLLLILLIFFLMS